MIILMRKLFLHTTQRVTQPGEQAWKLILTWNLLNQYLDSCQDDTFIDCKTLKRPTYWTSFEESVDFSLMKCQAYSGYIEMTEINEAIEKGTIRKGIYKSFPLDVFTKKLIGYQKFKPYFFDDRWKDWKMNTYFSSFKKRRWIK